MMLTELVALAEREGLMDDIAYQPQEVPYLLRIDKDGRFLGAQSTLQPVPGKKGRLQAKFFSVPAATKKRTVNIAPMFLCDTSTYVLGVDPAGGTKKAKRVEAMHDAFVELVKKAAQATGDAGLVAVSRFLEAPGEKQKAIAALERDYAGPESKNLPVDPRMTFILDEEIDELVCNRPAVRAYFSDVRAGDGSPSDENAPRCLVTGRPADPPDAHPAIKRVPGGQSSGCALVSFNQKSFESYGLESFANAPMSRFAAEAYARALNRLLDRAAPDPRAEGQSLPSRRFDLSPDTAVLFWSDGEDEELNLFAETALGDSPEAVRSLLSSPYRGTMSEIKKPASFYALTLSGSNARIVIRDWFESTVSQVLENVRRYFQDIEIASHKGEPRPLWQMLSSTAVQGKRENIHPSLASDFFAAIVRGRVFPRRLLELCLLRARAERYVPEARAALIKAYLVRARRSGALSVDIPEITKAMDETNTHPAYRLGRAFAVLEKVQVDAIKPGKTIRDRFYGSASANPSTVMPRLIRGAQAHFSKAASGKSLHIKLGKILEPVTSFPATLTLEEQGLFALGYYHQNQALYTKGDDTKAEDEGGEK